jgi:hypothetical protein
MKFIRNLRIGFEKHEVVRFERRVARTEQRETGETDADTVTDRTDENLLTSSEESDERKDP